MSSDAWLPHAQGSTAAESEQVPAACTQRFEFIGDVRGSGLMIGVEIVDTKASKKPAPNAATHIKETMVARHVLLAVDGPHANVVKIKPPMVFAEAEADHLIAELSQVPYLGFHACPSRSSTLCHGQRCCI